MKTKTAYRPKDNIPAAETLAPSVPVDDERIQPSETTRIDFATDKAEPSVGIVSADEFPEPDEAALALQKQLAHLKQSEELQRQHAAQMMQPRPMGREEKLSAWRANGGDEGDISFLESHPEMIDRHDVTVVAAEEAAQHHQRGTDAHRLATKEIFDRHLGHQQAQPAASAQPTPAIFQPPEATRSPAVPDRAALYSAPVSRGTPSGETGHRPARQITLTPQEQEYARVAGITDVEYAKQKQRLAQAKANGDYGERR